MVPAAQIATDRFISVPLFWLAVSALGLTIFSSAEDPSPTCCHAL